MLTDFENLPDPQPDNEPAPKETLKSETRSPMLSRISAFYRNAAQSVTEHWDAYINSPMALLPAAAAVIGAFRSGFNLFMMPSAAFGITMVYASLRGSRLLDIDHQADALRIKDFQRKERVSTIGFAVCFALSVPFAIQSSGALTIDIKARELAVQEALLKETPLGAIVERSAETKNLIKSWNGTTTATARVIKLCQDDRYTVLSIDHNKREDDLLLVYERGPDKMWVNRGRPSLTLGILQSCERR